MTPPLSVPDEFVQGLFKSVPALWQAVAATYGKQFASPEHWQQQMAIWTGMIAGATGQVDRTVVTPDRGDRRFSAAEWRDHPFYNLLKQSYLLNARLLADTIEAADIDAKEKHKLRFYARQLIDSMSPANFALTNPDVIKLALESKGESVQAGLANLRADLERKRISITDESAFEIGRNVAVSKGAVIFENDLFQLIQYAPLTEQVAERPLVIVPPCINKFYILDLQPENSFVRFACEQGQTVFLVSWRNPDKSLGQTTWDDYLRLGAMKAIEVACAISGADKVNALGWCVGGTIVAAALAVMRARGDKSVASLTLLTTILDFAEPGDLGVFIDEQGVAQREQTIGKGGIYPGQELGFVFQSLRANDLIWPYVINNYLKGKSPDAFDLLYWNADATNLPGPMYAYYLRNMYLENNLCVPGKLTMCDTQVDLRKIDMPTYVLATQEDHIVPWHSAYRSTQLVGGKVEFVLGASGHIAGVINPASKNRRSYWVDGRLGDDPAQWLSTAKSVPGSWWTHWMKWLGAHAGRTVAARKRLGGTKYKAIEPAPGRYVKARATQ
jgi:polyhydroxyalkanoate synthase